MKSYSSERTMKQESGRSKDTEAKLERKNIVCPMNVLRPINSL